MAKKKRKNRSEQIQDEQLLRRDAGSVSHSGSSPAPINWLRALISNSLIKTCVIFAAVLLLLHGFTWLFALKGYIQWGKSTAAIVSAILNATGIHNTVDYNIIHLRNDTWNVTSECTAVNAVFLFISFIIAYSSTLKSKAIGLGAGIPLIVVVNILRLVVLGWVTEYWPSQAHLFHDYVWETIFLFFIIALWFIWVNLVVNREKTAAVSC